ncbi:MAG: fibronectin type III domain-containing protein [Candidatus Bathyarchaeota archaeon]|uniref:fibronectin type III domain-containing protein n=1 Tax=Candidatus Bathycorpusculum sp. TaxID=2994959 RepID=UPI00281A6E7F|nr:fibronectin type III domain-containing protein [Candidatus Termiticorpusculum sp.]MCL2257671.1 fibronectin type III domain-containing protein [Candidatus Termiticorpusculum sp.]MCL2292167.1 fibronectin type III domain-containing protein [Candidatus Termiticorpusculum sp.]
MKNHTATKKAVSFALTLCVLFSMLIVTLPLVSATTLDVNYLTLAPGSDETQLTFSWHTTDHANRPIVRICKPSGATIEFTGTSSDAVSTISNLYYNRVTVTGLTPDTTYIYQVGDGNGNWSVEYTTKTGNSETFSYIVVGDPQIGSSGNVQSDTNSWINTMNAIAKEFPNAIFMVGTGDQIDSSGTLLQYTGFFSASQMTSLPFATCMGNHEGSGTATRTFYNPPNMIGTAVNYWYRYGDTLFLVWDVTTGSTADMRTFLSDAIAQNEDATWRILTFHYDVYGQGSSHALSDGKTYRDTYVPVIDEFDIDVVFNGHDHSYSRSYPLIYSGSASTSNTEGMQTETFDSYGHSIDPIGTVYFSLNSATGSKYYNLVPQQPYTAAMNQLNHPNFSIVDMTANTFTCTTYQLNTDNTITQIDTYTIIKTAKTPMTTTISLNGVENIVVGNTATYTVSVADVSQLATVTIQFKVDSTYFTGKSFTGLNGFDVIGDITWIPMGNNVWIGRVTLVNLSGGISSADALDIFEIVLSSNDNSLGTTDVKLVDAALSGYADGNTAVYIDSLIAHDLVQTVIGQYYSKYDINKDGVVNQLDLTTAQMYFMAKEGDANWNTAKNADVNGDDRIDIEDLILILQNITW